MLTGIPRVLISIPTRENIHAETVGWLLVSMQTAAKLGYLMGVHILYSPYPIELQRNNQVKDFLEDEKNYTHLFLLDSDCVPERGAVEKLLDYDLDIVASVAPALIGGKHCFTAAWETGSEDPMESHRMLDVNHVDAHGLRKVDGVGATGVLIKRHVLETVPSPWFKMIYSDERVELGEDFFFCKKVREYGFDVWADFDLRQKHYKTVAL
jgi:GT2 family glycosyltransferase